MKAGAAKIYLRILHGFHLVRRPMTLGVRIAAFDEAGRIALVRHTYLQGWYLPGGGVDPGERAGDAVRRELIEEANVVCDGEPALVSVHFNRRASRRDHVLLYRCEGARQQAAKTPDREIAEAGFFALDRLPEGTTPATLRRIAEILDGAAASADW